MKKLLAIVTAVAVIGVAGVAVAKHRRWEEPGMDGSCPYSMGPRFERGFRDDAWRPECPMYRHGGDWDRSDSRPAEGRWGRHDGWMRRGGEWGDTGMMRPEMGRRMERMWSNVPDDIRGKMVELAKLRIDMRDALTRDPVDRAKATEVYGKMAALRQEIGTWRFNQRLDRIERRQKEMELNREVPAEAPSPKTPGDRAPAVNP